MKNTLASIGIILSFSFIANGQVSKDFVQDSTISFVSKPSGFKMAGTFSYPAGKRKYPAVILIWGTGPHTRDQKISGFPMFKIIADHLNKMGFAVLRIDKRGFGKSEGADTESEQKTTSGELSDDIYSALQFLKKQPQVDTSKIGLIGHSEGAWIAEMVALKDNSVKWLGLLGAPVINGGEIQTDQLCNNLTKRGADKEVVDKVRVQIQRYVEFIQKGYKNDSTYYEIGKDFLLAHGMDEEKITHKLIDQLLDGFKTPWYQYFFSGTPSLSMRKIKVPMYFAYGGEDENVSLSKNIPELLDVMQQSQYKNISLTVLPGLDHFFEVKKEGKWTLSDDLLSTISLWLKEPKTQ